MADFAWTMALVFKVWIILEVKENLTGTKFQQIEVEVPNCGDVNGMLLVIVNEQN